MLVNMPITSDIIRNALFYILAHTASELHLEENDRCEALRSALVHVEGKCENKRKRLQFIPNNPQAKWTTRQDLQEHGEEARVWAVKIFSLIKHLAENGWRLNVFNYRDGGWYNGLDSFWNRSSPVVKITEYDKRGGFGEAEYVCDVCKCALGKLERDTFFA